MKKALLVLCCLISYVTEAQDFPTPYKFSFIDSVSETKDELYNRAHAWMAKTYNSANAVIQLRDKEAGKLIGKGVILVDGPKNGFGTPLSQDYVNYTIVITIKEGRYKCTMSDYVHEAGVSKGKMSSPSYGSLDNQDVPKELWVSQRKRWDSIKEKCRQDSERLMENLKAAMLVKSADDDF